MTHWFTVNEIPCFIGNGYGNGYFAPGRQVEPTRAQPGLSPRLARARPRRRGGPDVRRAGVAGRPGAQPPARAADPRHRDRRPTSPPPAPCTSGPTASSWDRSSRAVIPTTSSREAGADAPDVEPGDLELDRPADRLPRPEHLRRRLRPRRGATASPRSSPSRRAIPRGDLPWLNLTPQIALLGRPPRRRGLRRPDVPHHRERRDVRRRGRHRRARSSTSTAASTCASYLIALHRADRRGLRRPRLLRLVAARQLRMGRGLRQAVRHRPRRLRHPAAALPSSARSGMRLSFARTD